MKRQYSDNEKAEALAALDANGGRVSLTARQLGIPRVTLLDWSKGRKQHAAVSDLRQEKKEELAEVFERIARLYLGQAESVVADTKGKDAVIAAATAVDKMQLLKGEPTVITKEITPEERRRRVREWMKDEGILTSNRVQ